MQIVVDSQALRQCPSSPDSVYALAYGMFIDGKAMLTQFLPLREPLPISKSSLDQLSFLFSLCARTTVGNQQCMGLVVAQKDDKAQRHNEMVLSTLIPRCEVHTDLVVVLSSEATTKTLYYNHQNNLLAQQSHSASPIAKQLRMVHGQVVVNNWISPEQTTLHIVTHIMGGQWQLSLDNKIAKKEGDKLEGMLAKSEQDTTQFRMHLANTNWKGTTQGEYLVKGVIHVNVQVNIKMTVAQLKESIKEEVLRQVKIDTQPCLEQVTKKNKVHFIKSYHTYGLGNVRLQSRYPNDKHQIQRIFKIDHIPILVEAQVLPGEQEYYEQVEVIKQEQKEKKEKEEQEKLLREQEQAKREQEEKEARIQKKKEEGRRVQEQEAIEEKEGLSSLLIFMGVVGVVVGALYWRLNM